MKVALYARVSTEEQAKHGESISDQLQALRAWAELNGHRVVGEYRDEGYSAHKAYKSRPALVELLNNMADFDAVIFTKFDRWTRKASEYYKVQDILDKHGVTWKAILEDYDTMTSDGRFKVGIMLSVNQHEAERTSDRIKFTFAQKRARGELISGRMPRGYMLIPKTNKPIKDPTSAPAVQAFFDTYLQGRGLKAAMIAAAEAGCALESSNASFMLTNAMKYTGRIQGVECEPFISVEDAELILSTRRASPKPSNYIYLFSGLIVCPECGGHFGAHMNYHKRQDGTRIQHPFYNCINRHRNIPHECANKTAMNESVLERYLLDHLGIELDNLVYEAQKRPTKPDEQSTAQRIAKLEKRRERAINAYIDGLITRERMNAEKQSIDAELATISAEKKEKSPEEIRAILPSNWRDVYNQLTQAGKREFWYRIVDKIVIDGERNITLTLRV